MSKQTPKQKSRLLLFTADQEIDSALLANAVQTAQQHGLGLSIYATIPIDTLDQDVLDHLLPLASLKNIVERRRRQKIELFVAPYRQRLADDIDIDVHSGIEFVELIRTRMLGNYPIVLWIRNGVITRLKDEGASFSPIEQELSAIPNEVAA